MKDYYGNSTVVVIIFNEINLGKKKYCGKSYMGQPSGNRMAYGYARIVGSIWNNMIHFTGLGIQVADFRSVCISTEQPFTSWGKKQQQHLYLFCVKSTI